MRRSYYSASIANYLNLSKDEIPGQLTLESEFAVIQTQRQAWLQQIAQVSKLVKSF